VIIYFGTRLYGRTHVVPETCHVATCFFHIYRVPLIPLRSWIVTSQARSSSRGIKTTLSIKSVFLAWLRTALVLMFASACVTGMIELCLRGAGARLELITACAGATVASLFLWRATYWFSTAGPEKTRELLVKLGMSDEVAANFAFASETSEVLGPAR
jgi:hypothetical protein